MLLFWDPQKEREKEGKNNDAKISTKVTSFENIYCRSNLQGPTKRFVHISFVQ